MEMPTSEIVRRFKNAADKKQQIEILAQMNLCSPEEIRAVLIQGGVDQRTLPRKRKEETPAPAPAPQRTSSYLSEEMSAKEMSDILDAALHKYKAELQAEIEQKRASIAELELKIHRIDVTIDAIIGKNDNVEEEKA